MHLFKNMKKRYKVLIAAIIIALFIAFIYLFMTPDGALRRTVFLHGFPKKAVVMEYGGTTEAVTDPNQAHYVIVDPPYNDKTDTYEENWIVTKSGLFYRAECID